MASNPKTAALEAWFRLNSGYLHPAIQIVEDDTSGVHYRATENIEPGALLVSAPHSISLSSLNALVDDEFPVFRRKRHSFPIEAIGFFYLMAQYLKGRDSFWKPYLDSVPSPEDELLQPVFFENPEDVAWLEGTDVWHTVIARKEVYRKYYDDGITTLQEAGIDVCRYSWHLFLWAASIFTSRSFASRALRPEQGKDWTTYKGATSDQRQAAVVDMSHATAEDLIFPVLFPGLDAANHSHLARVDWTFDIEKFTIFTNDGAQAGSEVFNNYGPKGNGELLIGYGFCMPDNPYDTVALTLRPPPPELQAELKHTQPEFFTATGEWSVEETTFRLSRPPAKPVDPRDIFLHLPTTLLELLTYILRYERNVAFEPVVIAQAGLAESGYLPHMARMIAQSLIQKLIQLQSVNLPSEPASRKQTQAAIYRNGQTTILQDLISGLKIFTRSLIWTPSIQDADLPTRSCLVRLEHLIDLFQSSKQLDPVFLDGIKASAGAADLEVLREAGWEEDVWVLLLCSLRIECQAFSERIHSEIPEYSQHADEGLSFNKVGLESAETVMDVVSAAASEFPDSPWADERWSAQFIAAVGGEKLKHDSFNVMCVGDDGEERPRMLVYFNAATT